MFLSVAEFEEKEKEYFIEHKTHVSKNVVKIIADEIFFVIIVQCRRTSVIRYELNNNVSDKDSTVEWTHS